MADYSQYGGEASDWTSYMATYPQAAPNSDLSPIQLREQTNKGRESNSKYILTSLKATILTQDFSIPTTHGQEIEIRTYRNSAAPSDDLLPIFVFFHGGGYCFGTLESENGFCSWIAENTQIIVVNVCYRHTPEWKWPAQREDAHAALTWIFDNPSKIGGDANQVLVGGRSSGSNLAAGAALRDKDLHSKSRIKGLILDLPHVCHTDAFPSELMAFGKGSYEQNENAPILPLSRIKFFNELLSVQNPRERYYSILLVSDDDLVGFPPTHFLVAGRDPLLDEALLFEEKLKRVGIKTQVNVYPGVPHGFRRFEDLQMSHQYDRDLLQAFKWLLS